MKPNIIGDVRTAKQRLTPEKKENKMKKGRAVATAMERAKLKTSFKDSRMQGN